MCLLHVLEHFKHFKLFLIFLKKKSDTLFKNIFIAFLNSTAFVCYLEINLFFSHPKIRRKDHPTYSGQNIFMCLLHVLGHFKHFKLFLFFFQKKAENPN